MRSEGGRGEGERGAGERRESGGKALVYVLASRCVCVERPLKMSLKCERDN